MDKTVRLLVVICGILTSISACKKHDGVDVVEPEKGHFKIEFTNSTAQTMGFWETDPNKRKDGELCEQELNNVSIFVYAQGGEPCVYRRNFSSYEIEKKTAIFSLPEGKYEHNKTYDFYAVANFHYGAPDDMPTRTALLSATQNDLAAYMGLTSTGAATDSVSKFSDIYPQSTGAAVALRNDATAGVGFVMASAMVSAPVPVDDKPRMVSLPISRLVGKTEIKACVTDVFRTIYGDKMTLVVDTIKLVGLPTTSLLFANDGKIAAAAGNYTTICQIPDTIGGVSKAVIYSFENNFSNASAPSVRPEIRVCATFDFDGNPTTTDDITHVVYKKELALSGVGTLLRNTFYQIEVKINGLTPQEVVTTINVAPWITMPTPEDIEFGG